MTDPKPTAGHPGTVGPAEGPGASEPSRPLSPAYRWVVLGLTTGVQITASVGTQGIGALAPFWQRAFDLSPGQAALAVSAANAGPVLSMMVMGWAIDRWGPRSVVGLSMLLLSLAMVAASYSPTYEVLLFQLVVVGVWYAAAQPGGIRAITAWFPASRRGLAMGIRQAGLPLGGAVAAAALPVIALQAGWPVAMQAQAVVVLIGGLAFALCYRDSGAEVARGRERSPPFRVVLSEILGDRGLRPVLYAGFVLVSLQSVLVAHLMLHLTNSLDMPVLQAGFLLAVVQASGIAGRVLLAWLSDTAWKGRRLPPLQWSIVAAILGVLVLASLSSAPLWALATLCGWLGFFGIGWYTLFIVQVAESAPPAAVGSAAAFALTQSYVGIAVAPAAFGLLVDLFQGYRLAWLVLALLLASAAVWLRRARPADAGRS